MISTIIPENYRNVYQLAMKIFESALLSHTYSPHNLLKSNVAMNAWLPQASYCKKFEYIQYLRLYISKLNSKWYVFFLEK